MNIIVIDSKGNKNFIKSISYKQHTFKICSNICDAKKYKSIYKVQSDLDFLSEFIEFGYNFYYN